MTDEDKKVQSQPSVDVDKITQEIEEKVSAKYDEKLKDIESGVTERTQKLAQDQVSQMKDDLIKGIAGDKEKKYSWEKDGREKPKDWGEVIGEAEKGVDQKVDDKMKAWEENQKKMTETQKKTEAERITKQKVTFSKQWYDLVQQGKMTRPADEIMRKLEANEVVTEEEASRDRGLQDYRRLVKTTLENQGLSLKEAYYEKFNKEPTGMNAPIMGSDNTFSSTQDNEEYSYEDIHNK